MDSITELTPEIQIDTPTVWYGCYDGGWQDITPESFSHPAKFAQGLVRKIFEHGLEKGYFKPGMVIVDPFGGVGLGSKYALANGLSWIGCELERRFTDLGQGCDCTGISKADWVRFYGRLEKANYKDGRHWCPECLAQAKQVTQSLQLSFFELEPTAAYVRGSGLIPETKPHRYKGNLDLFKKYAKPGTFAVLLNGDSRQLRRVIGQAVADGLLSSPPYINSLKAETPEQTRRKQERIAKSKSLYDGRNFEANSSGKAGLGGGYGASDGQLSELPEGDLDGLLSSPPYANQPTKTNPVKEDSWSDGKARPVGVSQRNSNGYGDNPDNLGNLAPGSLADSLITSPPFAGNTGGRGEASRNGIDAALFDRHSGGMKRGTGDNPGNLDHLPMKGFEESIGGLVTSPPFEGSLYEFDQSRTDGLAKAAKRPWMSGMDKNSSYGQTAGQLGIETGQTFWAAARAIVTESYLALKPGSFSFWVCKKFVRNGCIVDFPEQWQQLCESVGFEYIETIRAMLVSQENEQKDLNGGGKKIQKAKKSFFRRLAERNGSPAIDFEEVVVMRKPEARQ